MIVPASPVGLQSEFMSTTVAAPTVRRPVRRVIVRIVLGLVLLVILGVGALVGWFYQATHSSLAQLDGTIAAPGLTAPVSIVRDAHGVPHFTAASLPDLFFAQG